MILLAHLAAGAVFDRPLSLAELASTSTAAAHGEILSTETKLQGGLIWTVATLEVWEGMHTTSTIQFRVPGGCVGDLCLNVSGAPSVHEGDQVVVFLRGDQVNNLALGLFFVEGDHLLYDTGDISFARATVLPVLPTLTDFRAMIQVP